MATLSLDRIAVSYGATQVLRDVTLEVGDGEFLVLVGPSGCGKSTLLRVIAGLVAPSSGEVRIDGVRVNEREPSERDLAMVFQNYALYPHMTVARNLAFPLEQKKFARREIEARVRETAESLGLGELLARKPGELSGGQMQRVALGRALVRKPKLFLFDEPLSNLDAKLRTEMRAEIVRLHQRLGVTSLYVTHDQSEAMTMGSKIAVLDRGRLEQTGAPLEVFARPASLFVAEFIGSPAINVVRGATRGGKFAFGGLAIDSSFEEGRELAVGLRPHELSFEPRPDRELALELEVLFVEALGTQTIVELGRDALRLRVCVEGNLELRTGERRRVHFSSSSLGWFDGRTGARLA